MPRRDLYANDYFHLIADDDAHVVHLVRTPLPFTEVEAIEQAFAGIERAATNIPHDWALLIDARKGPLRNDAPFEQALARVRGRIVARFARVAVLVHSAIGKLQVSRYARGPGRRAAHLR